MRLKTLSDLAGVVVNVLHTDTMVQWFISVQPGDFKTSDSIDKSIKTFNVNVTLCIGSLFLVLF